MGAYAQVSERLIERGYAAIPIMPGSKAPGYLRAGKWVGLRGWQTRFDNGRIPSPYQRQLWGAGDTGVGVVGGPSSKGMVRRHRYRRGRHPGDAPERVAGDASQKAGREGRDLVLLRAEDREVAKLEHQWQARF